MRITVENWLSVVTRQSGVSSITEEHVGCLAIIVRDDVRRAISCYFHCLTSAQPHHHDSLFGDPTYKLLITAHVPLTVEVPDTLRQSPWAVLDIYEGSQHDGDAPQWIRWSKPSVFFYHRIPSFTELFISFANLKFNSDQVREVAL